MLWVVGRKMGGIDGVRCEEKFFIGHAKLAEVLAVGVPDVGDGGKLTIELLQQKTFHKG